jgi:hypothetical protein
MRIAAKFSVSSQATQVPAAILTVVPPALPRLNCSLRMGYCLI